MQLLPTTTNVVSSNTVNGDVYSIQYYIIKWHAKGWWFSPGTPVSSTNKTDFHDIAEILLEVALNTMKQTIILLVNLNRIH